MSTSPRTTIAIATLAALVGVVGVAGTAESAELRGSLRSMINQHDVAVEQGYTFLRTAEQVRRFADEGRLALLEGNDDYLVHGQVTHPYARPEVRLLIERLASQYHAATGERLVVTSLVRPMAEQPANAHRLSVHPAGMAVDLRVPADPASRQWLQSALMGLERAGVLDVTREHHPPHYHVAVFPERYAAYAAPRIAAEEAERAQLRRAAELAAATRFEAAETPDARPVAASAAPADVTRGASELAAVVLGAGLLAVPFARRRHARRRP